VKLAGITVGRRYRHKYGIGETLAVDSKHDLVKFPHPGAGRAHPPGSRTGRPIWVSVVDVEIAMPDSHLGGCGSCFLGIVIDAQTDAIQACNDCAHLGIGFGRPGVSHDDEAAVHVGRVLAAMALLRDLCEAEERNEEEGRDYDTREEFEEVYRTLRVLTRLDARNMKPDDFADLAAGRAS
jgi:hypothetical protein